MIEGVNISKKFNENIIFEDFNFKINTNEFICFSGVSGSGKTTLLHMIGRIESLDSGKILVNNNEVKSNKDRLKFYRNEVGFLFQNFALVEHKSVYDNLNIIRKPDRTKWSIIECLRMVNLEEKIYSKVYTLSGGEQQRVAIARLFLKKCNIILADEPTGSLDQINANIIIELLLDLKKYGKTIVVVSHDKLLKEMADRVIYL